LICSAGTIRSRPNAIVLDIDDTDDPVHGQQELALFNAHYDCTCFQPIHIFEAMSGKPILSLLRPGKRPSGKEVARILRHVIRRIRKHWPRVRMLVRGDSHYLSPETLDFLQASECDYIAGLAINETLKQIAAPRLSQCDVRRCPSRHKVRRFHQFQYAAGMPPAAGAKRKGSLPASKRLIWAPMRASSSPTSRGAAKCCTKTLLPARCRRELDQGHEANNALRLNSVFAMGGQSVPPLSAHGGLLAPACTTPCCTEALTLAWCHARDDSAHLREDRRARRGVEKQNSDLLT
jgi:Transposase DDE domain group 1